MRQLWLAKKKNAINIEKVKILSNPRYQKGQMVR